MEKGELGRISLNSFDGLAAILKQQSLRPKGECQNNRPVEIENKES